MILCGMPLRLIVFPGIGMSSSCILNGKIIVGSNQFTEPSLACFLVFLPHIFTVLFMCDELVAGLSGLYGIELLLNNNKQVPQSSVAISRLEKERCCSLSQDHVVELTYSDHSFPLVQVFPKVDGHSGAHADATLLSD